MVIVIIDRDEISRAALAHALKAQNLAERCVLVADISAAKALSGTKLPSIYLLVGGGDDMLDIKSTDHFTRPLRAGEILDRVRRYSALSSDISQNIEIGPYMLDVHNNELSGSADGACVRLTDKETRILTFLAAQKGAVVNRQTLLDKIWGYAKSVETHTLETHIYRLRQKIEKDPSSPTILITAENGYFIDLN